jgi:hypothetical protein
MFYLQSLKQLGWMFYLQSLKQLGQMFYLQSSQWKFEFTGPNQILEFIYIQCIYLNKSWKIYWFEQSFTGSGPEDRCTSWGLIYFRSFHNCGTVLFFSNL